MAGGYVRDENTMYSVPLRFADTKLTHCPFCGAEAPKWLVKNEWKLLGRIYHYLCPHCESVLQVTQDDVTGLSFTSASFSGKMKQRQGKQGRTIYVKVETIGYSARTHENVIYEGADIPLEELMKLGKKKED